VVKGICFSVAARYCWGSSCPSVQQTILLKKKRHSLKLEKVNMLATLLAKKL